MKNIDEIRVEIDQIDSKIKELFLNRLQIIKEIIDYKKSNNLPFIDEKRELSHLFDLSKDIIDEKDKTYYQLFLKSVMNITLQYEESDNNEFIGYNTISNLSNLLNNHKALFILDDNISSSVIYDNLNNDQKENIVIFSFKAIEELKNIDTVKDIIDCLIKEHFKKDDYIVGLGGGITLDIAGFVASIYKRGISYISIPTTILSMCDASIGSKCGVNFNHIKNQIGSFYDYKYTIVDFNFIKSLPKRIYNEGFVEIIKLFATSSKKDFELLENNLLSIEEMILNARKIKKQICLLDKYDSNIRYVLNFGHTFGHAVEALSNGSILHGEGVAIGMVICSIDDAKKRIINLFNNYSINYENNYSKEELIEYIYHDKKYKNGYYHFIMVKDIGSYYIEKVSINDLDNFIEGVLK